jgi:hypothetical protein
VADLIYTSNVSLDGFIEDHQGSFDFTAPDDDVFAFITGLGHLTVGGANLARQTSARASDQRSCLDLHREYEHTFAGPTVMGDLQDSDLQQLKYLWHTLLARCQDTHDTWPIASRRRFCARLQRCRRRRSVRPVGH